MALHWPYVPISLFYLLCAIIGVIGNAIMIIVFLKNQKFKNPVNYLITLNCLSDSLHVSGHFVFNYQLFSDCTSSQATCYFMLFHTAIGYCISGPLLLSIGIDRLIACKFPIFYRTLLQYHVSYLGVQLLFPVGYTVALMIYGYGFIDYNMQITCMAPLALPTEAFLLFTYSSNIINISIVIIYLITYFVLRNYKEKDARTMRLVFKSMALTVLVVLFGWTTVTVGNTVAWGLISDKELSALLSIHAGFGVNVACSINVFVFYAINSDYRSSIRRLFGLKTSVAPGGSSGRSQPSEVTHHRKRNSMTVVAVGH